MGNQVYANGMEVACKAADGKSICAFPDVCLTPPPPPAGPLPIPYPNTGMASDTDGGSKTVQISGKEIMLKDKSSFKKSTGDEAATNGQGAGVVTHKIKGKIYFTAWSMDVKVEGENVVRHLDLTTHNHGSLPSNTGPWPYIDAMAVPANHPCKKDADKEEAACKDYKPHGSKDVCVAAGPKKKPSGLKKSKQASKLADRTAANKCLAARRCILQPYKKQKGISGCCPQQTAHHLVEASAFFDKGRGGDGSKPLKGVNNYNEGKAPCVCAEGVNQNSGTHALMHTHQSAGASKCRTGQLTLKNGKTITAKKTTFGAAKKNGATAMKKVFPQSKCNQECIEAQLEAYHKECGVNNSTPIKAVETGQNSAQAVRDANAEVKARSARVKASIASSGGASI